jgi:F-type H+-transporting ATPase subunit epsilon
MRLEILLPFGVFADEPDVSSVVAETRGGSFGLLPHRLDCVALLAPGLLVYRLAVREVCVAVDEGVLVKTGAKVCVSVRRAIGGRDLGQLRKAVVDEFARQDEQARSLRSAMAQLESGFLQRMAGFERG